MTTHHECWLFVASDGELGGAEKRVLEDIRYALNQLEAIHIIVAFQHRGALEGYIPEDSRVTTFDIPIHKGMALSLKAICRIRTVLATQKPSVLIGVGGRASVHCRLAQFFTRTKPEKHVYSNHGYHFLYRRPHQQKFYFELRRYCFSLMERLFNRYVDAVICVSNHDYYLAQKLGYSQKKISVIYNGISKSKLNHISSLSVPFEYTRFFQKKFIMVCVAALNDVKGHEQVLEALRILREQSCKASLCLIGGGDQKDRLESKVKRLGLENEVLFTGRLDPILTDTLHSMADISILMSSVEGMPRAMMEAMLLGVPVVCSDIPGNRELLDNGKCGFLVKNNEPMELAHTIKHVYHNDINVTYKIRQASRRIAKFDFERCLQQRFNIYRVTKTEL